MNYFFLYKEEDFKLIINKANYENLIKDLFDKCFINIDEAIKLGRLK